MQLLLGLHLGLLVVFIDPEKPRLPLPENIQAEVCVEHARSESYLVHVACEISELVADRETGTDQVLGALEHFADKHSVQSDAFPAAEGDDGRVGVASLELQHFEVLRNEIVFQRVQPFVHRLHRQSLPVSVQLQVLPEVVHVVL